MPNAITPTTASERGVMKYYQVLINSENRQQAGNILDHLLTERLVIGGPIFNGPAKFLWEGTLMDMDYCLIVTYTREATRIPGQTPGRQLARRHLGQMTRHPCRSRRDPR